MLNAREDTKRKATEKKGLIFSVKAYPKREGGPRSAVGNLKIRGTRREE